MVRWCLQKWQSWSFRSSVSMWEKFSTLPSVLVLQFRLRPCHNFEIAGIGIELNVQCIHGLPTHTTKVQLIPLEHDQSQQTNSKFCIIIAKLLKIPINKLFSSCRIKMDTTGVFLKAPILDFRWHWWSSINCPALSGDFLPPGFLALIR